MNMTPIMEILLSATLLISWLVISAGVYYMLSARKKIEEGQRICQQLTRDLQVAGSGSVGMGIRIVALEKKLSLIQTGDLMVKTQEQKAIAQAGVLPSDQDSMSFQNTGYKNVNNQTQLTKKPVSIFDQAKQLLRNGISERQVIKTCGLSADEVALMKMLIQSGIENKTSKNISPAISTPQSSSTHVFA
ncbi:MAG: hypothetical protein K6L75_01900 [Cellvibrionaceae bacterium]